MEPENWHIVVLRLYRFVLYALACLASQFLKGFRSAR